MKRTYRRVCCVTLGLICIALSLPQRCQAKAILFSGRAIVLNLNLPGLEAVLLGDTGPLPEAGGSLEARPTGSPVSYLSFQSAVATTTGSNICAVSEVTVSGLTLTFNAGGREHLMAIGNMRVRASTCCFGNGVAFSPQLEWSGFTLNGAEIPFQVGLNQRVEFEGGHLLINTQDNAQTGNVGRSDTYAITIVIDGGGGGTIGEVHSDISCPSPNEPPVDPVSCDRVKGHGSIKTAPIIKTKFGWMKRKGKATFIFSGRRESTGEVGRLVYIDHAAGLRVVSVAARAYSAVGENSRRIAYEVKINGQPGQAFVVVTDNGTPGAGRDTFIITLSTGYTAQGTLLTGNVKLQRCPPPFL